ncbi:uncharacterized protein LOC132642439 [Lycium barbarum]|uniref:uncharacterized protein LOC132642439 n=1 Tax=Lycium barbarum TaxID=112863 RepID=UPI00293F5C5A|nr:uncharacterized protein LOC132642439 [Lycium barbarum]
MKQNWQVAKDATCTNLVVYKGKKAMNNEVPAKDTWNHGKRKNERALISLSDLEVIGRNQVKIKSKRGQIGKNCTVLQNCQKWTVLQKTEQICKKRAELQKRKPGAHFVTFWTWKNWET